MRTGTPVLERLESRTLLSTTPLIFGGAGRDLAFSTATDTAGNIYVAGTFQGTVDFDPGAGTKDLTASGAASVFVAKYSPKAKLLWAKRIGGITNISDDDGTLGQAGRIAVDSAGSVYVTGAFSGKRDFDPGSGAVYLTSAGKADIFVAKLTTSGTLAWAKRMGGAGAEKGLGLALDSAKNVVISGFFEGKADFNPSSGTAYLTSTSTDAFVAKLTSAGKYVWAKRFGGTGLDAFDWALSVATDASKNVIVGGFFQGKADFDPGTKVFNLTSAGQMDAFVLKLSSAGAFVWARRVGGKAGDVVTDLATDSAGNIYACGAFTGAVDFNPGAAIKKLTSAGSQDAFILKLSGAGAFSRAQRFGSAGTDAAWDVAVRGSNICMTGLFTGSPTYGADPSGMTSAGGDDPFIARLRTSDLSVVWGAGNGSAGDDWGLGAAFDSSNNVIAVGFFNGAATFDLTSKADLDSGGSIVIAKLGQDGSAL